MCVYVTIIKEKEAMKLQEKSGEHDSGWKEGRRERKGK